MKKLFFAVILFTMAIVCLAVGVSCKKKNAGTNDLSDYEESLESIESSGTKTSESLNSSDTADTTESVKASEETSISESVSSEASASNPESGKSSETTETSEATETPESSESSEETKPSESTETPESSESSATSEGSSESVSESNSENASDSVESSSEKFDSETVSESETATGTDTDTEPATDDSREDSSESNEESKESEEPSDSGDSSESGGTSESVKTVIDIANGNTKELTVEADEVEFTLEFFSILKGKGYTHFKFNAESDGVGDYELSNNKYSPDDRVADIRVEAYRFFDKSVCLRSGGATCIRIYDFVFFSSEETENLTFGDNGYLCYEDEGLVYADYGSGDDYGFKFPDKYFEFERSIENGNAVVTYKTSDGNSCDFKWLIRSEVDNSIKLSDPIDGIVSNTSIYVNKGMLSKDFIAIRPDDRKLILFNKSELVYSGELEVKKSEDSKTFCRPDKECDKEFKVECKGNPNQSEIFCLKVVDARDVKIIIETESGKDIWLYSDNVSYYAKEANGKYETTVTLSDTGSIKIVIENCKDFRLRYEIIS